MKRICTIFLAVTLLLGTLTCLPLAVSAASEGDFEYEISNGEATITRYTGNGGDVIIPATLGGYPVTTIDSWTFFYQNNLTSINIPASVKKIQEGTFAQGDSGDLTSITVSAGNQWYYSSGNCLIEKESGILIQGCSSSVIPDGVKEIGWGAFRRCKKLTSIAFPYSVRVIGRYAFSESGLTSITIPDSVTGIWHDAFSGCDSLASIYIPVGVTEIDPSILNGCTSLMKITVAADNPVYYASGNCIIERESNILIRGCPGSTISLKVTEIGSGAFNRGAPVVLELPLGVTKIGSDAFNASELTSIKLGERVREIGSGAFSGCKITSLDIPKSVTTIGEWAFSECKLTSIDIPKNVTTIGKRAFAACLDLESVRIENGTIGEDMFQDCISLRNVNISDNVTEIGEGAFFRCRALTDIVLPDSVTDLGTSVFFECDNLTNVSLSNNLTSIPWQTFLGCHSLKSITIPNSVTEIGDFAFRYCDSLTSIFIPKSVKKIGGWGTMELEPGHIFAGCSNLTDIYCGALKQPEGWAEHWLDGCNAAVHWGRSSIPSVSSLGDLGGDGQIDATDYMLLKRYCLGTFNLTEEQLAVADVNKDGDINALDYMLVKRHVLGTFKIA